MHRSPANAIEVHVLTKRYGDVLAVDDIGFAVPPGATFGLLGGNGAGKTTTIAMLLGLLIPTAGTIRVLGHDMARDRFAALARMNFSSPYVALPQRLTVAENLRVYGHLYNVRGIEQRIAELAAELDLGDLLRPACRPTFGRAKNPCRAGQGADQPPGAAAARRADRQPRSRHRRLVRGWLERYRAESGCTILLARHNMAEVERLCTHVLMLKQGRSWIAAARQDLLARYGREDLEEVFLDIARDRRGGPRELIA